MYNYTDKCKQITGLSNAYELYAREMVVAGMIYFDNNPMDRPIIGECKTAVELSMSLPAMFKTLLEACPETVHPKMMVLVLAHLKAAVAAGWDNYIMTMEIFASR